MPVHGGNAAPPGGVRPAGRGDCPVPHAGWHDVTCSCGSVYRVHRQRFHQVQRCPACGDELFVLPLSPYPEQRPQAGGRIERDHWNSAPRPGHVVAKGATFRDRLTSALELPDEPIDVEPIDVESLDEPKVAANAGATSGSEAITIGAQRGVPTGYAVAPPREIDRSTGPRPADRPSRPLWRRPRLIMLLAGVLLALTVALPLWSGARERWAEAMRRHAAEGRQAYAEGDFATAKAELGESLRLMRRLQWPAGWFARTSRYVRELHAQVQREGGIPVEQAYGEAAICEDLLAESLHDVARDAADWLRRDGPEAGRTQFESRYQGAAVIFDTTIGPGAGGPAFAAPLVLKADDVFFRIDARDLELFHRMHPGQPRRVLFGARLDTIVADDAGGRDWRIRLQPSSGVLFTQDRTLQRLGWTARRPFVVEPELSTIIERQRAEVQEWSAD